MKVNCAYDELVPLEKIIPSPRNYNKHNDRQIEMLAKIIDYQGQRRPIVVSNRSGFIVCGEGRYLAIKKLGWEKAAVDFQDYESEAQEYADMVADNKVAEMAEADDRMIIDSIKELQIDDFEFLGLDDFNFARLLNEDVLIDEKPEQESIKKYAIQVEFPNDMEMNDIKDDLLHRGYIVKVL